MTDSEREQFASVILALAATFRVESSEALLEGYWMALEDLEIGAVRAAVRSAIRSCERMPTGSELRRLTGEMTSDMRAVHAWGAVQRAIASKGAYVSVDFDDPVVNATVRNLGGWQKLCATSTDEAKWVRKDFERIYDALCSTGVTTEQAKYLTGIAERQNAAAGYEVQPPVRVMVGLPAHRQGVVRQLGGADVVALLPKGALTLPEAREKT